MVEITGSESRKDKTGACRGDQEKRRFFLILFLSFAAILIFNVFTPMLSDDYAYAMEVQKAGSVADLFRQEFHQYMTWNGRSVVHLLLRIFLYLPGPVFKVANSLAFVFLSYLMTRLIAPERKHDCYVLLMVQMGLWLYAVDFSETILWEDGACNYLWGALFILLFMVLERELLIQEEAIDSVREPEPLAAKPERKTKKSKKGHSMFWMAAGMFLLGLIAGWCNENTSGGCLLYLLLLALWRGKESRRQAACSTESQGKASGTRESLKAASGTRESGAKKNRLFGVPIPYLAGILGNVLGLAVMVLSPGGRLRASYAEEENYQGFLGILARVQKITLTVHQYFGLLLAVSLVCLILLALQNKKAACRKMALYLFVFAATSYALAATRQTQARAFFGAGLFLLIAVITGIREVMHSGTGENRLLLRAAGWSILAVLLLRFFFTYVEEGTNLARIWRDETNRIAYIKEQKEAGAEDITVPLVHTDFYNSYSAMEKMEMTDDPGYWINIFYEEYYGISSIRAIPYDDWAALTGQE